MKFSFMSFSTPQQSLDEMLQTATNYGYEGIEPRTDSEHAHGIEVQANSIARQKIGQRCAAAGIEIACLATSCEFADPRDSNHQVEQARQRIDLAADIGCSRLRVFGGKCGKDIDRTQAIELVSNAFSDLAQHAAERGVAVCMETHDDWTDPVHVANVMQRVDHPAIAVNWDAVHPVRNSGSTFEQSYELLQPWIQYVHVHDALNTLDHFQFMALGRGDFDHRQILQILKNGGYDGYLSGEWIDWEPASTHLPRELKTLREYLAQLDT